jgi:hypothetical protein
LNLYSSDIHNKKVESLRNELLGPEKTNYQVINKIAAAEELLSYLELEYQVERKKLSSLSPIWFDRNAIISSASALAVVLIIGIAIGFQYNMQSDIIKFAVPLSVGIGMIPFVTFAARNNYIFQQKNAILSSKLSEMMNVRGKITLFKEKLIKLSPVSARTDFTPMEMREDIVTWLEKILDYIKSITEIPEYELQKYEEANAKAKQIVIEANQEFSIPGWRMLSKSTQFPLPFTSPDLDIIYDEFVRIVSNPDSIVISDIRNLKTKVEVLLNSLRNTG